jgi:hypothetical protein
MELICDWIYLFDNREWTGLSHVKFLGGSACLDISQTRLTRFYGGLLWTKMPSPLILQDEHQLSLIIIDYNQL